MVRPIDDVLAAVGRKSAQEVWRDAPLTAERMVLVYCQVPVVCLFDADEFPAALAQRGNLELGPWAPSRLVVMHAGRPDTFPWNHRFRAIDRLNSAEVVP